MVVEIIKARLNVSLYNPYGTCEVFLYLRKCRVAAPLWPESVGVIAESRLIDSFENHSDHFLYQLIVGRCDSQRTEFTVLLGNILPFCGLWLVRFIAQGFYNPVNSRQTHVIQRLPVNPLCHASL